MFRHYHITAQPAGVSKRVRRLVMTNKEAPNLKGMSDISDYLGGGQSDSEGEDAGARVTLAQDVGRANSARTQSSLKLHELGPRMALELVKLEEGVCTGQVCFAFTTDPSCFYYSTQCDSLQRVLCSVRNCLPRVHYTLCCSGAVSQVCGKDAGGGGGAGAEQGERGGAEGEAQGRAGGECGAQGGGEGGGATSGARSAGDEAEGRSNGLG
jgi:hypothetical protein